MVSISMAHMLQHGKSFYLYPHSGSQEGIEHIHKRNSSEFLLKCPKASHAQWKAKARYSITWSRNGEEYFSIQKPEANNMELETKSKLNISLNQWQSLRDNSSGIIANADGNRYKFELEERRQWAAFRIRTVNKTQDYGQWTCHLTLFYQNSTAAHFESRKSLGKKYSVHTYTKRHKSRRKIRNHLDQKYDVIEDVHVNNNVGPANADVQEGVIFTKGRDADTVFQRMEDMGEVQYIRKGNTVEYTRVQSAEKKDFSWSTYNVDQAIVDNIHDSITYDNYDETGSGHKLTTEWKLLTVILVFIVCFS
ncbi:hypothetical protein DdX_04910 [Ditylenchus destructor]|uniref:Ig-like domain-containing protein n=1 Tax=Ditylenchus destructor TaxID=166010 RepID=A0AAD4NAT3_9BILA|nr:hypothetical protein DdX_04910 [Ditylenchus destructor]